MDKFQISLLSNFSTICCVMPYYDYADKVFRVLKTFSKKSRAAQANFKQAIANSLVKRTLQLSSNLRELTYKLLWSNDTYMMFKLGIKLEDPEDIKLFSMLLKTHPKAIYDSVVVILTNENYLLVNEVVKTLKASYMVTGWGVPLEKFLQVECSSLFNVKRSSILYTSRQNFSKYDYADGQKCLEVVDTVDLTDYYGNLKYDIDSQWNMIVMHDKFYLNFGKWKFASENFKDSVKRVSFICENLKNFEQHEKAFETILNTFSNSHISELDVTISMSVEDTIKALSLNKIKTIRHKSNHKDSFTFSCVNLILQVWANSKSSFYKMKLLEAHCKSVVDWGDYVILQNDLQMLNLDDIIEVEDWTLYDKNFVSNTPCIFIHKKFINQIEFYMMNDISFLPNTDCYPPSKEFEGKKDTNSFPWFTYSAENKMIINSGLANRSDSYDYLTKILSTEVPKTVPVEFYVTSFKGCNTKQFNIFVDALFNSNLTLLDMTYLKCGFEHRQYLYHKIARCTTLKHVKLTLEKQNLLVDKAMMLEWKHCLIEGELLCSKDSFFKELISTLEPYDCSHLVLKSGQYIKYGNEKAQKEFQIIPIL